MTKKEIVQQLKQDIYKLVDIAQRYAPDRQIRDEITVAENCVHAGLADYELAHKQELAMRLEQGRVEQIGEQQR